MSELDNQIKEILDRNKRVEQDKAWETSWVRRFFITFITYLTACLFLWLIDTQNPHINALVPTGGYLLSTLSLPWLKSVWLKSQA